LQTALFLLGGAGSGDSVRLSELGAQDGWPGLADGYRLITANFLHFDLVHLISNTEGLLLYGWGAIRMFGLARASFVYMLAALASGVTSALVFGEGQVGAGSSGCVFPLIALVLIAKVRLSQEAKVGRWRGLVRVTGWALFALPPAAYFNWAAHLSGIVVGTLMGLILAFAHAEKERPFVVRGRVLTGVAIALFAVPWVWRLAAPLWDPCGTGSAERCRAFCASGDSKACYSRALGELAAGRTEQADPLLLRACDGGLSAACAKLGVLRYERGFRTDEESHQLHALFERACEGGSALGCTRAGNLVPDNPALDAKALAYFKRGCDGGNADGCYSLGLSIANDRGQAPSLEEAARLYRKACDGGRPEACRELSVLVRDGTGTEKDWDESWALLERACSLGDKDSCAKTGGVGGAYWKPRAALPPRAPISGWIDPLRFL
jgi:membrane associated rhomboid family serine protease